MCLLEHLYCEMCVWLLWVCSTWVWFHCTQLPCCCCTVFVIVYYVSVVLHWWISILSGCVIVSLLMSLFLDWVLFCVVVVAIIYYYLSSFVIIYHREARELNGWVWNHCRHPGFCEANNAAVPCFSLLWDVRPQFAEIVVQWLNVSQQNGWERGSKGTASQSDEDGSSLPSFLAAFPRSHI